MTGTFSGILRPLGMSNQWLGPLVRVHALPIPIFRLCDSNQQIQDNSSWLCIQEDDTDAIDICSIRETLPLDADLLARHFKCDLNHERKDLLRAQA